MVDQVPISGLPAVPSAQDADIFPGVQSGVTYKESRAQLFTNPNVTGNLNLVPNSYSTGTIQQVTNDIILTGGSFTSAMDGGWIVPATGSPSQVIYIGSSSMITSGISQTIAAGTNFTLYYGNVNTIDNNNPAPLYLGTANATKVFLGNQTNCITGVFSDLQAYGSLMVQSGFVYIFGTASQSGTTVTGSGTTWTSSMVGGVIHFINGKSALITAFGSTTSLTVDKSQTVAAGTSYSIYYSGLQASQQGNMGITNIYFNNSTGNIYGNTTFNNNSNKAGTVSWTNKVNGSSSNNQSLTSASTSVPFLFGNMSEFVFDTLDINGAVSANLSGTTALTINVLGSMLTVQNSNGNNGNQITFVSPGNAGIGVYMVEYSLPFGNIRGIVDITYKANGSGSFANLRMQQDCFDSQGDGFPVSFRDFITVTTAGNPISIKWTANGKNASSTNFWFSPIAPLRITQIG